jgi:superfamily II helicase
LEPFETRLKTIDTVLQVLELSFTNVEKEELTSWEIKGKNYK